MKMEKSLYTHVNKNLDLNTKNMQRELLYAWAVAYRQAGWCVLPAENKFPLKELGGWKKYQEKLPTLEQTKEWFTDCPQNAQIALVTGKISGVSVIDIDCHIKGCGAKKGLECDCKPESPEELLADVGLSLTSYTGSGGYHVFCEYTDYLKNTVGMAHPQLDIRSDGGIIILPPSPHWYKNRDNKYIASGKDYEWWDMAPWNQNNLENLMEFPKKYKLQLVYKSENDWVELSKGTVDGSRNIDLTKLIGKLVRTFGREDAEAAYNLAWLWNQYRSDPPQNKHDFVKTFNSVARNEFSKPNSYDRRKKR